MKHKLLLFLFIVAIISCSATENNKITQVSGDKSKLYPKDQLLEDYDQITEIFEISHPKTFVDMDNYKKIKEIQRNKISDMSEYEFYKLLSPLLGVIDCSHTVIYNSDIEREEALLKGNYLPVDIRYIDGELYIVEDFSTETITPGSKITSINGNSSSDIVKIILDNINTDSDNRSAKKALLNKDYGTLRYFGDLYYAYIESPIEFIIEYIQPESENIIKTTLPATQKEQPTTYPSLNYKFEKDYAKLTIPNFMFYEDEAAAYFNNTIESFFKEIEIKGIDILILDLRGNFGGDSNAGEELLSYLLNEPFQYFAYNTATAEYYPNLVLQTDIKKNAFKGKIYTIIDGNCISTTAHIVSHLLEKDRSTLIGQETGASYLCVAGQSWTVINNTKMFYGVGTTIYKTLVEGQNPKVGIKPDVEINYGIKDYLENRDLEMEYILSQVSIR